MARIPIALELFSVREDLNRDPHGTLKRVVEMGYEGVEFAGFPLPAAELKGILDELGLVCCSSHTPLDRLLDDKIEETVAFNKVLGNDMLIVPWIGGDYTKSGAGWQKAADLFNGIAAKLAPHGMVTGYHNHHTEFGPSDTGETPWDILFGNTRKDVVMQLDTGNAVHGGGDCAAILRKYPGRAVSVHLKPYSPSKAAQGSEAGFVPVIGEDELPWPELLDLCETVGGTQWYVVEYESDAYPSLEGVERCLKGLRALGR